MSLNSRTNMNQKFQYLKTVECSLDTFSHFRDIAKLSYAREVIDKTILFVFCYVFPNMFDIIIQWKKWNM